MGLLQRPLVLLDGLGSFLYPVDSLVQGIVSHL